MRIGILKGDNASEFLLVRGNSAGNIARDNYERLRKANREARLWQTASHELRVLYPLGQR